MLQCPRCSNPLTVAECPCSACSRVVPPCHVTNPMGRDPCPGGVIQYPQNQPATHQYQNTTNSFKADSVFGPQISSVTTCAPVCGLATLATGATMGTPVGLQQPGGAGSQTVSASTMMYPPSITGQYLLQQAKEEEQQINAELINLQIKVLQNQLEQAKLQQELIKSQSQTVRLQPQVPTQLVTSSISTSSSTFSPPTPAILVAANQTPFFSNQPNLTFNVGSTWCPPSFTPPPEVPLPRTNFAEVLRNSQSELSECCWYHGSLSWQESSMLLQNTKEGTFLVRDSQDHRFLYSLSVQRPKEGPTSVRIQFHNGLFSLDAEEKIRELMPRFKSVCELVEHYVSLAIESDHDSAREVLIDQRVESRQIHSPIILRQPLFKKPPTLAHFARIAINRSLTARRSSVQASARLEKTVEIAKIKSLKLPPKLIEFLEVYPLSI